MASTSTTDSVVRRLSPDLPVEVQLEVTGACNLACTMCLVSYRPKIGRRSGAMSLETFREVLDRLPGLQRLTLQGLGEPLLAPDIVEMVREAASRGIDMGFNSNANLLTRRMSEELLSAGLGWLHVSVDGDRAETYEAIRGGSDFETLRRNVIDLVEVRRALGREDMPCSLVMVAMRRNLDQIAGVVRLAAEWGVNRVRVQNLSHTFSDTDPAGSYAGIRRFAQEEALWGAEDLAAARTAFADASRAARNLGVDLRLPRLEPKPATERPAGKPGCDWPWTSSYVTHTGDVQPCCMVMGSDRATLGNVKQQGFDEIWRGERYQEFREALLSETPPDVCAGCAMYRGVF